MRDSDLFERGRKSARRAGIPSRVRRNAEARQTDLDSSRAHCKIFGLSDRAGIALRNLVDLRLALRIQRRDGANRIFENARRAAESQNHYPSRGGYGSVFRRPCGRRLGPARCTHFERGLQAAAEGAEEAPARLFQNVLRGHGNIRLEISLGLRARFLRCRPRDLRIRRPLRPRRRPHVHPRNDKSDRRARYFEGRPREDLLQEFLCAARNQVTTPPAGRQGLLKQRTLLRASLAPEGPVRAFESLRRTHDLRWLADRIQSRHVLGPRVSWDDLRRTDSFDVCPAGLLERTAYQRVRLCNSGTSSAQAAR